MRRFIFICSLVLLSAPAFAGDVASAFDSFCTEWMQKLAAREEANVSHIKWEPNGASVQGAYVGYTQEHTCTVKDGQKVPVGKIMYREVRYEKRGDTVTDAQQSPPHPVETTEVTEIFRYDKGKWVY